MLTVKEIIRLSFSGISFLNAQASHWNGPCVERNVFQHVGQVGKIYQKQPLARMQNSLQPETPDRRSTYTITTKVRMSPHSGMEHQNLYQATASIHAKSCYVIFIFFKIMGSLLNLKCGYRYF